MGNRLLSQCVAWCKSERLPLRSASTLFTSFVWPSNLLGGQNSSSRPPSLAQLCVATFGSSGLGAQSVTSWSVLIGRVAHPTAVVWRWSDFPTAHQEVKVLGTPLGHTEFITRLLETPKSSSAVQSVLLLFYCAPAWVLSVDLAHRPEPLQ